MTATHDIAAWLVGAVIAGAALMAALGYLVRWIRSGVHVLDRMETLLTTTHETVERELEVNTGSSMKDDVTAIAITVGNLWRELDDLRTEVRDHLDETERHKHRAGTWRA